MFALLRRKTPFHTKSSRLHKQIPFLLADIGEGISEVQVLQWHVKPGQRIQQFDKIAEVQSDKAAVEITSRYDGVVSKLHYKINDIAKVGAPLIEIDVEAEESDGPSVTTDHISILPRVRKLALEKGVDLNQIVPVKDKITEEDVLKAADSKVSSSSLTMSEYFMNPVRKSMLKSMQQSLQIPHFGYCDEYNWTAVDSVRKSLGISSLPIAIKALSETLKEFPQINAHFNTQQQKLMLVLEHNVAVAMDTEHGLVVPVIKNVQGLSIKEIADNISDLQKRAQENRLRQVDFEGATISLSNIGSIGGIWASPVIVPPQVCIAAAGRARVVPIFTEGKFIPQLVCPWSWSADHRVVDGATIARFSQRLKAILAKADTLSK